MLFWVHTFKNWDKNWGHQVCLEATVQNVSSNHNWENRKHDKEVRTEKEISNFIIMLNFLFCRYL